MPHGSTATPTHDDRPDLGSGQRFGADVYELYEAGQVAFPDLAASYSHAASELHYVARALDEIAGRLGHVGAQGVVTQAELLYDVSATTAGRLHLVGQALILLADDFRRTDELAADTFHRLAGEHRDLLFSAPPWTPPPRPGDLPDCRPRLPPAGTDLSGLLHEQGG